MSQKKYKSATITPKVSSSARRAQKQVVEMSAADESRSEESEHDQEAIPEKSSSSKRESNYAIQEVLQGRSARLAALRNKKFQQTESGNSSDNSDN